MKFGVFASFKTLYSCNKFIIEFPNKTVYWLENSYGKTFNNIKSIRFICSLSLLSHEVYLE